ncbi:MULTISPECIES: hypothetical protein [unclassified Variovorax]|uniref:hypothetical protein n=1 Tax=unclassified Variovorax TaxID=663243 RepID=UPI000F7E319F|nr:MULTISPECIES: hypothetical protein [unclassified Variovorax]RSZ45983.1 hypothetical protein EJO70_05880 [Variovorax sp. 553]RSZ46563.1 hypothetical protein EJO71_05430 [Variovorax sp. 679]
MDDDSNVSLRGYAGFQLARAFAALEHADVDVREGAAKRLRQWTAVLRGSAGGILDAGSRKPVKGTPAWATLEVVTGGFATGALLAGGLLRPHERRWRDECAPGVPDADARRALNSFFLTDAGLERLQSLLVSGRFGIEVPEEGALLVVAWLVHAGAVDDAWALVEALSPWFSTLRFYPAELPETPTDGMQLWVDDVATATKRLQAVKPNPQILAQKEAVGVWGPLYDRMATLMFDTVAGDAPLALRGADGAWLRRETGGFTVTGGWPCARYPEGWRERALAVLADCAQARAVHTRCARPEREGDSFSTLREALQRCVDTPASLTGKEVGRIRLVLARYRAKRGLPDAAGRVAWRQQHLEQVGVATFAEIAQQVTRRLQACRADEGLDDTAPLVAPIDVSEAAASGIRAGTPVPSSLRRKVERACKGTAAELVERGVIPSGDVLARVLPRWSAALRAADVSDLVLRRLLVSLDRAFRLRRSLLLVDLQAQVRFEELPWVAAIGRFREGDADSRRAALQALTEASQLALVAFPQAILPNKLLQELWTLGDAAGLKLPLVEEVAADIFMGRFSPKFLMAAKVAAKLLQGGLYERYYGIDCAALGAMPVPSEKSKGTGHGKSDALAHLCASRAGVQPGGWGAARNGMVLEQAQVLTTHNLAVLFTELGLGTRLEGQLPGMAHACFAWVCERLQIAVDHRHARLIQIKNSASAWRQMVFFLSLCSASETDAFLVGAKAHLDAQGHEFRRVFAPALSGLAAAAQGTGRGVGPFLGWSQDRHWLMPEALAAR